MTHLPCSEVREPQLAAYSDEDLPPEEAKYIRQHVAQCPRCQESLRTLQSSLGLLKTMWKNDEERWQEEVASASNDRAYLIYHRRIGIVAAALILVALGAIALIGPKESDSNSAAKSIDPVELEFAIEYRAVASQMLAIADLFAQHPEGRDYAAQKYKYIIDNYQSEREAAQARLQVLLKRRSIP